LAGQVGWQYGYIDGTTPWLSLIRRVAQKTSDAAVASDADRSIAVDYSRHEMPAVLLSTHGAASNTRGTERFRQGTLAIQKWTDAIRSHGRRVVLVVLHTSNLTTLIERRLHPREQFWDPFSKSVAADSLHHQC